MHNWLDTCHAVREFVVLNMRKISSLLMLSEKKNKINVKVEIELIDTAKENHFGAKFFDFLSLLPHYLSNLLFMFWL